MAGKGIRHKLIKVFFLQLALISLVTLIGVFAAARIVEDVLVRYALQGEAAHFWSFYRQNPQHPTPNTMNLLGYLSIGEDYSRVPSELHSLEPGYFRAALDGRFPIVYIEDHGDARLFLVFDEEQVSDLSFYFGTVPLGIVLVLLYLFAWFSYRQSSKAISPVIKLSRRVDRFNFQDQGLGKLELDDLRLSSDNEILVLVDALDHFTERLRLFIERERNFTRDASHELRTPLAVVKSSLALLTEKTDCSTVERRALERIDKTVNDMEDLIETLLLLAREESSPLPEDTIIINDLIRNLLDQMHAVKSDEQIDLTFDEGCLLTVQAPEKVLFMLFSNLIRNAYSYTKSGTIKITIGNNKVGITDSGIGMTREQLENVFEPFYRASRDGKGHGLGLAIVKRLCDRYQWTLKVSSKPGEGTRVTVIFPDSQRIGKKSKATRLVE